MATLAERFQEAVQAFWTGRSDALQRQIDAGKVDAGSRGAVTSGSHMGAIEALIVELLGDAGLDRLDVKTGVGLELPGFYRPEKRWDLLVVSNGQLVTAIELKSQVGPSFGNNYNNRVEEAIGNATDIWTAFREGRLGTFRPFLGYLFLLEDTERVHAPVRSRQPYFPVDSVFDQASYANRYATLCQRLVLERLYDAACLTLATKDVPAVVSHPDEAISFERFIAQIQGHATGFATVTKQYSK